MMAGDPEAWRSYASTPAIGAAVMRGADLDAPTPVMVGDFPLIVLRTGGGLRAYVNACPHQFLPLDHHGNAIVSADGSRLMCTVHGAQFTAEDGAGVAGPGLGCALEPVPVHEDAGGMIRIGAG
jgi:nitrite reductase/ring-hydroxylating ferredoxin subunit